MSDWMEDQFVYLLSRVPEDSRTQIRDARVLKRIVRKAISRTLPRLADYLFEDLMKRSATQLSEAEARRRGFEERLVEKWGKPLNLLHLLVLSCYDAGAEFNEKYRKRAYKLKDYMFDALTRLHARACQVASEVLSLLQSGFADGAHARWRTLHEIAVTSFFIRTHGQDIAKRFLQHVVIENYKDALEFQKHCVRLGYEPLSDEEMQNMRRARDEVLRAYGAGFDKTYGWIPREMLGKRDFKRMEKSSKLDRFRPYYNMASNNVHSGSKGIRFRLGLGVGGSQEPILLAGPSNYGLADPAQCSAISLHQVTTCLLTTRPTFKNLTALMAVKKLVGKICLSFSEAHSDVEKE